MALGVQGSPFFECAGRYQRLACEHRLCTRAIDRDDYKLVPSPLQRRKITGEGETRLRAIRITRLSRRDVGARDTVTPGMRASVQSDFDAAPARRIERPAG